MKIEEAIGPIGAGRLSRRFTNLVDKGVAKVSNKAKGRVENRELVSKLWKGYTKWLGQTRDSQSVESLMGFLSRGMNMSPADLKAVVTMSAEHGIAPMTRYGIQKGLFNTSSPQAVNSASTQAQAPQRANSPLPSVPRSAPAQAPQNAAPAAAPAAPAQARTAAPTNPSKSGWSSNAPKAASPWANNVSPKSKSPWAVNGNSNSPWARAVESAQLRNKELKNLLEQAKGFRGTEDYRNALKGIQPSLNENKSNIVLSKIASFVKESQDLMEARISQADVEKVFRIAATLHFRGGQGDYAYGHGGAHDHYDQDDSPVGNDEIVGSLADVWVRTINNSVLQKLISQTLEQKDLQGMLAVAKNYPTGNSNIPTNAVILANILYTIGGKNEVANGQVRAGKWRSVGTNILNRARNPELNPKLRDIFTNSKTANEFFMNVKGSLNEPQINYLISICLMDLKNAQV